jgi:hypothetical protein
VSGDQHRRSLALCTVGAWQARCCEEDLYRIDTEEEAEQIREEIQGVIDGDDECATPRVWATRLEALRAIRAELAPGESTERLDRMIAEERARVTP